ncbi:MAG: sulfatase-like hydrolase/transferase [Candidatus Cryptobacteroides sp.]
MRPGLISMILPFLAALPSAARGGRPNIVLFLVDDLGLMDTSVPFLDSLYAGNYRFNTPNIKELADRGVVMTSAYACPLSTPTRDALMSGMNAAHSHITSFTTTVKDTPSDASAGTGGNYEARENEEDIFRRGDWNWNGVSPEAGCSAAQYITPYPAILAENGYFTVHAGKSHWAPSGTPGSSAYNMGFLSNVGGGAAGYPRSYQSEDNYGNTVEKWNLAAVPDMVQYYQSGVHLTEALAAEALKLLDYPVRHGIPFYLELSHYAVHSPYQPHEPYYSEYLEAGLNKKQAMYASMVTGVDAALGVLVKYLEDKGIDDNTVIIFYSDNGGYSASGSNGAKAHTQNSPLREGKGSCYEGGIRVPMIVSWPKKTRPGIRVSAPVVPEDFYPSILELAGIQHYRAVQPLDGKSFVSLLRGRPAEDRFVVTHFPHQWRADDQPDIDFLSAIRYGKWKLVYRMHDASLELYDLNEDIGENRNVAGSHPDIVKCLAGELSDRLRGWNATMPVVRSTGLPVPFPDELL